MTASFSRNESPYTSLLPAASSVHANEKVSDEEVDGEDERRQSGGHLEAAVGATA